MRVMKIIYSIISFLLSYIIPKSDRVLLFSSYPDYTDNSYAVYQYLRNNRSGVYKLVWIFNEKRTIINNPDVLAYYKYSLKGVYYFFRAKYVFCTHGLYSFLTPRQGYKIINLWHGMPLKNIGSLDPKNNGYNPTKADYLIATSDVFQEIMAKSFNDLDMQRVLVLGQPRNDLLFKETTFFSKRGIDPNEYASIGVWLPTYKQSAVGDIRCEGVYNDNGIAFLSMDELRQLDNFLVKESRLLIVKLHPMDALQNVDFENFRNLLIIKQKDFNDQLYTLLGAADYLLTDYSSVWVDYCVLNRPIGFVMNDMAEYEQSRGFTIEGLNKKLPGAVISSYNALMDFILQPVLITEHRHIYNKYLDNKSSERLIAYLDL